jgi:hypothetical protein
MQQPNVHESSVLCNLRQLMQLEQERVAREQALHEAELQSQADARERREREIREEVARAEAEREAAALRARAAVELAACTETEREAALLRARLEAAAVERSRVAERERQLAQARTRGRMITVSCSVLAALGGALLAYLVATTREPVRPLERNSSSAEAERIAEQARELLALRQQLAASRSVKQPEASPSRLQPKVANTSHTRSQQPRAQRQHAHAGEQERAVTELDNLGSDADPISGL